MLCKKIINIKKKKKRVLLNEIFFVIPARKGSKGFPHKNRKLLDFTIKEIPKKLHSNVIVTTDDDFIIKKLKNSGIKILKRDKKLANDKANIKDVIIDVIKKFNIKKDDIIIMLYLTSPKRKFKNVQKILKLYLKNRLKTLTCCVEVKSHPFLCFYELPNNKGRQIVKHDLYRRQDYLKCFEMRHFVVIFHVNQILKLNKNMYSNETYFYKIKDDVDVDHKKDFEKFMKKNYNFD